MEFFIPERYINKMVNNDPCFPATKKYIENQIKQHLEGAILLEKCRDCYKFDISPKFLEESSYNNKKFFMSRNRSFIIIQKDGVWVGVIQ